MNIPTLVLAMAATANAVPPQCYLDPLWNASSLRVLSDIVFGSSFNNKTGVQQELLLDAYLPPESDNLSKSPVAVLVHGGGFTDGDKAWSQVPQLAVAFAQRGLAAVSVNYRLTGDYWSWESDRPALDAVEDVRAAVRFVRSVAAAQRLDVARILLAGESAGAVTALYLGYAKVAQYEGASGNPGWPSTVAGVISISGELRQQAYCDSVVPQPTGCQIETGVDHTNDVQGAASPFAQPPLLVLHGTADTTVPYVDGKAVYDRAQAVGLSSELISMEGAAHVPWDVIFSEPVFSDVMRAVADGLDLVHAQQPAGCTPLADSPHTVSGRQSDERTVVVQSSTIAVDLRWFHKTPG